MSEVDFSDLCTLELVKENVPVTSPSIIAREMLI